MAAWSLPNMGEKWLPLSCPKQGNFWVIFHCNLEKMVAMPSLNQWNAPPSPKPGEMVAWPLPNMGGKWLPPPHPNRGIFLATSHCNLEKWLSSPSPNQRNALSPLPNQVKRLPLSMSAPIDIPETSHNGLEPFCTALNFKLTGHRQLTFKRLTLSIRPSSADICTFTEYI